MEEVQQASSHNSDSSENKSSKERQGGSMEMLKFWEEADSALKDINPNTLNFHTVQYWAQTLMLLGLKKMKVNKQKSKNRSMGEENQNTDIITEILKKV